jgi:hypothetical protein
MAVQMTRIKAISEFFSSQPHGSKVEMSELKVLSSEDRIEVGDLCLEALGATLSPPK